MSAQRRVMQQTANGKMRREKAVELLPDQIRHLAWQDDPAPCTISIMNSGDGVSEPAN